MKNPEKIVGHKVGYLEVKSYLGKDKNYHDQFMCECKCGKIVKKSDVYLIYEKEKYGRKVAKSCGCAYSKKHYSAVKNQIKKEELYVGRKVWFEHEGKLRSGTIKESIPTHYDLKVLAIVDLDKDDREYYCKYKGCRAVRVDNLMEVLNDAS